VKKEIKIPGLDDERELIKEILLSTKNIAVVGFSRDPAKDAHIVPIYLMNEGYSVFPVNPYADEIAGLKCFHSLDELYSKGIKVDTVLIFRPSNEAFEIVNQSLKLKPKYIWMQVGIEDQKAAELARNNGIKVVMNKCMMVSHKSFLSNFVYKKSNKK